MPIDFDAAVSAILVILVKSLLIPLAMSVTYGAAQIALTKAKAIVASWSDDRRDMVFGWVQVLAKAAEKKIANGSLPDKTAARNWVLTSAQAFLDQHNIKLPLNALEAMLEWTISEGLHKAVVDEEIPDEVLSEVRKFGFGNSKSASSSQLTVKQRLLLPNEKLQGVTLTGENPGLDYGDPSMIANAGSH
jgi:hypothetical protein